jgi:hypothetical protein
VAWCERWNIKINEDKTQAIYFSRRRGPVDAHLTLKGWNIPFVKDVKYLCIIFDRKINEDISYRFDRYQGPPIIHQNLPPSEN